MGIENLKRFADEIRGSITLNSTLTIQKNEEGYLCTRKLEAKAVNGSIKSYEEKIFIPNGDTREIAARELAHLGSVTDVIQEEVGGIEVSPTSLKGDLSELDQLLS